MKRTSRFVRWVMVVCAAGVLPAAIMRCDKAALNFQRGLYESLGDDVGSLLISQVPTATGLGG